MISKEQYIECRKMIDIYDAESRRLYGKSNGWVVVPAEATDLPYKPTNEMRSAVEVYEWMVAPPANYFAYVNEKPNTERMGCNPPDTTYIRGELTTWTGEKLAFILQATGMLAIVAGGMVC